MDTENIYQKINNINNIIIVSHYNPDGDAIGSSLALWHFFKNNKKEVYILIPNSIPDFLEWLPGCEKILIYEHHKLLAQKAIQQSEMCFYIDFNGLDRLETMQAEFQNYNKAKVLIDHHPYPDKIADYTFSDISVGSTAELVFEFMKSLPDFQFTKEISECIYTGIMTDTVDFKHNVNEKTYKILSELLNKGIDKDAIHSNVYDNFSVNRMQMLGFALNKRLVVIQKLNTGYIYLKIRDQKKYNYKNSDSEGFVNYPLSIKNIKISALFIEKNDHIKISFRSKGSIPVNQLAEKYFNGGGHINAAGGKSYKSLKNTIKCFEKTVIELQKYIN